MALATTPAYPAVGQEVSFSGAAGTAESARYELTSKPSQSRLALGLLVDPHPTVVQTIAVPLTYSPRSGDKKKPATIGRGDGSFVADGYIAGMTATISGTTLNDGRVTITDVTAKLLTVSLDRTLTAESIISSLTGTLRNVTSPIAQRFTPDVAGEYQFSAYYYQEFAAPPMYSGDPSGGLRTEYLSAETATLHVGGYVELPLAPVNGHGSTLRLLVVNETVRAAELANPRTELARLAALDSTVAAAVQAMVGVTVANLDVDFVTDVNDLCTLFAAHIVLVGGFSNVHNSADTTNTLLREPANSIPGAVKRLSDLAQKLAGHMEATSSGGTWHNADDLKNTLQVAPFATTLGEAVVLKADVRERVFRRHVGQIASPASHDSADGTNLPTTPVKTLPATIAAFLDYVAASSSAVAGEPEGIADAVAALGFRAV